ncbi:hypothetical protein K493DRAFT_336145 [Basidiobolus meristosporus CBS 931.73]|uniref:Arrestin C-terminal-like domain-containing protein n=1 Tax=Basidiobolus meristosporus CBS 931.73 TaxID=1314790 RepID=A0A1Y1YKG9_9FUNG|nr:hypothetical protein K493DRAFT_336145 [Basidiobolus meristosporus CBS 931.73]|eukprot:ORX98489.1 hypothetical protein K493DRAFT_336145 [Basidiobolus meristosporus CBS 931.73]
MSPKLLIKLEKDTFTKNILDEDDPNFALRGKLIFVPSSPIKVQCISLAFRGKLSINKGFQSTRKVVFNHRWDFLQQNYKSALFDAKEYAYEFELPLPYDLPESVDADYATIQYSLRAMVETPFFGSNIRADKVVYIRQNTDSFAMMLYNTRIENSWKDALAYEVIIPSHEYVPGDSIPITFKHRAQNSDCIPISVWAGLDERTTYRISEGNSTESVSAATKWLKAKHADVSQDPTTTSLLLEIPKSAKNVHYNCTTAYVEVTHYISTRIEVRLEGVVKSIRAALPVCIVRNISNNPTIVPIDALPDYHAIQSDAPPNYRNRQSIPPDYSLVIGV